MTGPREHWLFQGRMPQWRRPESGMPPWLAAILTVTGILLVINALPMLAGAITPDRSHSASFSSMPSPIPLTPEQTERAIQQLEGGAAGHAQDRDVTSSGGNTSSDGSSDGPRGTRQRGPLPVSGANALAPLVIGTALLGGGLALMTVVGFSGARPWPGRYVRRNV